MVQGFLAGGLLVGWLAGWLVGWFNTGMWWDVAGGICWVGLGVCFRWSFATLNLLGDRG